ncbi:type II restriction endonuclease [Halalkalibacter oceani]|uniref:type II restriction endonuclease n=1 Tax=Halalkalibacter oceani TaxID=1653776 RepID=UPI0033962687
MSIEAFKKYVKKTRTIIMTKPKKLVEEVFEQAPFFHNNQTYFFEHCTEILYYVRKVCWRKYTEAERKLTSNISEYLISSDSDFMDTLNRHRGDPKKIITDFLENYSEHLFELSKSHTNSRRSRAGKEFEVIIEILLLRNGVVFDNQGVIGSKLFKTDRLGKLVDCVVPGVAEYSEERRKCALVSMKTSLRERWQEVIEEMTRTGAHEMFLVTLDEDITKNTIEALASHNVTLVVPDDLKDNVYNDYHNVYGLTKFLKEMVDISNRWKQRDDLSTEFYEKRLLAIETRLKSLNNEYVCQPFEEYKVHCEQQVNKN